MVSDRIPPWPQPPTLEEAQEVVRRARKLCREAEPHDRDNDDVCVQHILEAHRQAKAEGLIR